MSYNLNQAAEDANSGSRYSIYADGVKTKRLKAWSETGVKLRLMPAFGNAEDPNSFIPFRNADGQFAPFARLVPIYDSIGHGDFKNRRKLLSAKAFDASAFCILHELSDYIKMNSEWAYMHISPGKEANGYDIASPFPKKARYLMIMNVVEPGNQSEGSHLIECSVSVFNHMNGPQGILSMVNPQATAEGVAANPSTRWYAGDITDPVTGPIINVYKDGQTKGYAVRFAMTPNYQMEHLDCTTYLAGRYNLDDENIENVLPPVNEAEQVQTLLDCLRGVSPSGRHEWKLLKEVFGQRHSIPDPPDMGAVQPNPVPQQQAPAAGGLGANPATTAPAPAPGGVIPGMQPPPQNAQPAPAQPPVQQAPTQPAPPQNAQPAPAQPPVQQAPVQQPPVQQPPVQQPPVQTHQVSPHNPQPTEPPSQDRPAVPGADQQYDTGAFLDKLKGGPTT